MSPILSCLKQGLEAQQRELDAARSALPPGTDYILAPDPGRSWKSRSRAPPSRRACPGAGMRDPAPDLGGRAKA